MKPTILKQEQEIVIPTPLGQLEALKGDNNSKNTAIICSPHPHFDGSMHNKVVATLTKACLESGLNTLRFNYRGVGKSSGKLPTYAASIQDVTFLLASIPGICSGNIVWLGFSYGAYVAAYGSGLTKSLGLVTVAPSVANMPYQDLPNIDCKWHMLQGMDDEVIDITPNLELASRLGCKLHRFEETGHFFHGKIPVLCETVKGIMQELV